MIKEPLGTSWSKEGADVTVGVITAEETGTKPQERDVSTALEKNDEILLGCSSSVACFANVGTVEAWSLESGMQQKESELLCKVCNSSRAGVSCLPSLPLAPGCGHVTTTCVLGDFTRPSRVGLERS
jgi:hypothetical protein